MEKKGSSKHDEVVSEILEEHGQKKKPIKKKAWMEKIIIKKRR